LILSRIDARNGAFALVTNELDQAVVSNDFPVFNIDNNICRPDFLAWLTRTQSFIDMCTAISVGTTNRVRLDVDEFLAMEIPLPDLDEQRRIVEQVEAIARRIEEARRLRAEAVEEAERFKKAFARRLMASIEVDPSEIQQWLNPNRKGIQTGPFGSKLSSQDFVEAGVPVLKIGNVQYAGLEVQNLDYVTNDKAAELSSYSVEEGDILFARMGTVGRCCVVPQEADGWLFNYHIIRLSLDKSSVEPRYAHWVIQASQDVEDYLSNSIRGATRKGVNSSIVASLPIRVPDMEVQRSVVKELDWLQNRIEETRSLQEEVVTELEALLPAILDKAFRGDLL